MQKETDVTDIILMFVDFINSTWGHIYQDVSSKSLDPYYQQLIMNDWLQFHWEVIVEIALNLESNFGLEVYGEGAEIHLESERIRNPHLETTHYIGVSTEHSSVGQDLLTGNQIDLHNLVLNKFVHFDGINYFEKVNFNHVLFNDSNGPDRVLPIESVLFVLRPYT